MSIFPAGTLREDLYGAFILGILNSKNRGLNVIVVAEILDSAVLDQQHHIVIKTNSIAVQENILDQMIIDHFSSIPTESQRLRLSNAVASYSYRDFDFIRRQFKLNESITGVERAIQIVSAIPSKSHKSSEIEVTKWSDIGGYVRAKQLLTQSVLWFHRNQKDFCRLGIKASKGTLLYGPPGCGKTLLAKSVAQESGATFHAVSIPQLIIGEVGESEKAISKVFADAKISSPSIIFMDEVESLFASRDRGDLSLKVTNSLDNIDCQVVVLAATNHVELVDKSILRAGRIDRLIHIPLPSKADRFAIIEVLLAKSKIANELDIENAATITEGMTGSDIKESLRRAMLKAIYIDSNNPIIRELELE